MSHAVVKIIDVSPISLPVDGRLKRSYPRPIALQDPTYQEKFDTDTLAYDVFMSDDKLVFSGPPALGLDELYTNAQYSFDGELVSEELTITTLDRVQRNWLKADKDVGVFEWSANDFNFKTPVNTHQHDLFRDKKVLFTLSKNNKPMWIADWINYYKANHGVDAVLFYDNGSDNYDLITLKNYLAEHTQGVDIVLVPWNFKYGPQGGISTGNAKAPWDSDFCQYGMMEHAKERFLKYAKGVINADVDELIVCEKHDSIFEALKYAPAVQFPGKWIESIPLNPTAECRFNNFFYFDKRTYVSDFKWCISPIHIDYSVQWKVHTVKTKQLKRVKDIYYAHFKPINYNWKLKRVDQIEKDDNFHLIDERLYQKVNQFLKCEDLPAVYKSKLSYSDQLKSYLKQLF